MKHTVLSATLISIVLLANLFQTEAAFATPSTSQIERAKQGTAQTIVRLDQYALSASSTSKVAASAKALRSGLGRVVGDLDQLLQAPTNTNLMDRVCQGFARSIESTELLASTATVEPSGALTRDNVLSLGAPLHQAATDLSCRRGQDAIVTTPPTPHNQVPEFLENLQDLPTPIIDQCSNTIPPEVQNQVQKLELKERQIVEAFLKGNCQKRTPTSLIELSGNETSDEIQRVITDLAGKLGITLNSTQSSKSNTLVKVLEGLPSFYTSLVAATPQIEQNALARGFTSALPGNSYEHGDQLPSPEQIPIPRDILRGACAYESYCRQCFRFYDSTRAY